ncbi:17665_t:CDS:1, partial [Funneliformis geosporum]
MPISIARFRQCLQALPDFDNVYKHCQISTMSTSIVRFRQCLQTLSDIDEGVYILSDNAIKKVDRVKLFTLVNRTSVEQGYCWAWNIYNSGKADG